MPSRPDAPPDRFLAPPLALRRMPRVGALARLARPGPGISHVLAYGQSLSSGWDGWPALSQSAVPGLLMLGDCVRPAAEAAPAWRPVGAAAFRPLAARVQRVGDGALLPAGEAGPGTMGETVLETALAEWRRRAAMPGDARLLAASCGVGARTIEALADGAAPDLFARLADCAGLARDLATAAGAAYRIAALLFLQGEHNSRGFDGGASDGESYARHFIALHDAFQRRVVAGVAGQAAPAAIFIHQTGGDYASDAMGVAQAQLDLARAIPSVFLAAPAYPLPARGGHLDPNGYRWLGAQFGRAMHRVLTEGRDWRPLHPLRTFACGDAVHVDFHVPAPPLAFGQPFIGATRGPARDQGFAVTDAAGPVPIAEVALDGPRSLRLQLGRRLGEGGRLRYAGATPHAGRGGLHDSDRDTAAASFVDLPGNPPSGLAGRPYPLMNWCVAFTLPLPRAG